MPVTEPLLTGRDVVLGYGATVVFTSSSFAIPRGSVTAVIGPNGSGKSTLLSAIAGLIEPVAGALEWGGPRRPLPRVAYVLQMTKVNETLPVSVREVVTMGRYATLGAYGWLRSHDRNAIAEAMDRVGIAGLAGRRLDELSGGQRQRVYVAQGLAQDHDVLLLDEPMTGLDLPSAQAVDDVLHGEQERGGTVVMTTHDLSEAWVADHVLLLAGRVVAEGSPREVLTRANLAAAYGPSILHVEGEQLFFDDPAHLPVQGRHVHRERTIHVEPPGGEAHEPG